MLAWSVVAKNLPEHSHNPIHTDDGAIAAGFDRALVAGVTSYAYCLHPVIEQWGIEWVRRGTSVLQLRSPMFAGDLVEFDVTGSDDGGLDVAANVVRVPAPLVRVHAVSASEAPKEPTPGRDGERLNTVQVELNGEYGSTYAQRAGDDQQLLVENRIVHPAVWPALANYVFHRQLARGPWIHTRSKIVHHDLAFDDEVATIETVVVDRFVRSGARAVAEVRIRVGDRLVAVLEHEAIVDLGTGK